MLLAKIVSVLEQADDDICIGMARPWKIGAPCCLVKLTDDYRWPEDEQREGFVYFLEISVAKEVLDGCHLPLFSIEEQAKILIFYAENDAWPEWVNARLGGS